jgi:hypothetical protein
MPDYCYWSFLEIENFLPLVKTVFVVGLVLIVLCLIRKVKNRNWLWVGTGLVVFCSVVIITWWLMAGQCIILD